MCPAPGLTRSRWTSSAVAAAQENGVGALCVWHMTPTEVDDAITLVLGREVGNGSPSE